MTGFTKLCKWDASLKGTVAALMSNFTSHWDEEIQQRAVEYEFLLKSVDADASLKELYDTAFDDIPTYPDSKQTNSVLMRRMGEIKSEKGFKAGKEEEEKKEAPAFRQSVSSALSKNKEGELAGVGLEDVSAFDVTGAPTTTDSLLDMGDDFSGGSIDHAFAKAHPSDFSSSQTVDLPTETTRVEAPADTPLWKGMVPQNVKEGTVYEDDSVRVQGTFMFEKYDG